MMHIKITLFACIAGLMPYCLHAQEHQLDSISLQNVISPIEKRWEQPGGDSTIYFILEQVRRFCGEDDNCPSQAYYAIMSKPERWFLFHSCREFTLKCHLRLPG